MNAKISKDLVQSRLERAKEELENAKLLYTANSFRGANNRAYYSIYYSIKAILALESIDFKSDNEVLTYFNQNYISSEIFSRTLGKKIMQAKRTKEDSEYDDEFIVNPDVTKNQIDTAEELIKLVEKYVESKIE